MHMVNGGSGRNAEREIRQREERWVSVVITVALAFPCFVGLFNFFVTPLPTEAIIAIAVMTPASLLFFFVAHGKSSAHQPNGVDDSRMEPFVVARTPLQMVERSKLSIVDQRHKRLTIRVA